MYILNDDQYEFDTDNIHLRPTTKISNKCLKIPIKIDIKGKKKHFLIQTPKMYIPFGINNNGQYNNKNTYLDISFRDKDYNTYVKNFYNFLKKVRTKIKKLLISEKIIKKNKNNYPEFIDSIKKDNYGERMTTRFNNIDGNHNVNIYDNKKDIKKLNDVKKGLYCILILNLSDVWVTIDNNSKALQYGFSWVIMQMKIYEPLSLDQYCFIESSDEEESEESQNNEKERKTDNKEIQNIKEEDKIKNHHEYKVYFNMLKYGIPIDNITYKMKLNGHDDKIINLDPDSKVPKDLFQDKKTDTISSSLIKDTKLKKTEIKKKDILKEEEEKEGVPSLNDILGSIQSLKKTNYKNKYTEGIFYDKDQYLSDKKIKELNKEIKCLKNNIKKDKNDEQDKDISKNNIIDKPKINLFNPMQNILGAINKLRKD